MYLFMLFLKIFLMYLYILALVAFDIFMLRLCFSFPPTHTFYLISWLVVGLALTCPLPVGSGPIPTPTENPFGGYQKIHMR